MADYSEKTGIFIRSKTMSVSFKRSCISELERICRDRSSISLIIDDDRFQGFRIHFFTDSAVDYLLSLKYIKVDNKIVFVYPLETSLVVENVIPYSGFDAESVLSALMEVTFGKVVRLRQKDAYIQPVYTSLNAALNPRSTWYVSVSVPEIEDLPTFKLRGSPRMILDFPYMQAKLEVKFHCSFCDEKGHTRQNCRHQQQEDYTSIHTMIFERFDDKKFSNSTMVRNGYHVSPEKKTGSFTQSPIPSSVIRCIKETSGVLTANEMKSFLTGVKGKVNLMKFTQKYTHRLLGVKVQLKRILSYYSKLELNEAPEERRFLDWFEKLIQRYENELNEKKNDVHQKSCTKVKSEPVNTYDFHSCSY